ncbi:PKD domain-containing protein [Kineococcus gynurae]|uniref:PKD domain-containing protein n=1 Tax=Kineococcus gynurae TaxID=452979 RepID=A0ABV5LVW8_9ACTN
MPRRPRRAARPALATLLALTTIGVGVAATSTLATACTGSTGASAGRGSFEVGGSRTCDGDRPARDGGRRPAAERHASLVDVAVGTCGNAGCDGPQAPCAPGLDRASVTTTVAGAGPENAVRRSTCVAAGDPGVAAAATPVVTAADLRSVGLPAAEVRLEPPTGEAVVGLPVNVWTRPVPVLRTVDVLGVPVTVRAVPRRWTWRFGDGATLGPTADPGHPWPAMTTTHTYSRSGTFTVSGTTTWTADYLVPGAGWRPVAGTVEVDGDVGNLTVRTATNLLTR